MHVDVVGDDPGKQPRVVEQRPHHAGRATGKLGHRVEQMRAAAQPLIRRAYHRGVVGLAMTGKDSDTGLPEPRDRAGRSLFRGEGDEQGPAHAFAQCVEIAWRQLAHRRRGMDARARGRKERPLEVQPENARLSLGHCLAHGLHRREIGCAGRGDEGRQQMRRAATPRRLRHAPQRVAGRRVVEHHPAAAVDLQVDEAGGRDGRVQGTARRRAGGGGHVADAPPLDHDGPVGKGLLRLAVIKRLGQDDQAHRVSQGSPPAPAGAPFRNTGAAPDLRRPRRRARWSPWDASAAPRPGSGR